MTVVTAIRGDNSELVREVFAMYAKRGMTIADVTYGQGTFWRQIDTSQYTCLYSDLKDGVDFRSLPLADESVDILMLDPPYMHGGEGIKESINKLYRNEIRGHYAVNRLYAGGILEAARVLKRKGLIVVKTKDEIDESKKQRWTHIELIGLLELLGFRVEDLFVLVQNGTPAMRTQTQNHARKNHSYAIVARLS